MAYYEPSTQPPVVELTFDSTNNTFTLDTPNSSFAGRIEYCVTAIYEKPNAYSDIQTFESSVQLTNEKNYIWARCVGDPNFKSTDWAMVAYTEYTPKNDAPHINYDFDKSNNILALTIADKEFKGHIEYYITETEQQPEKDTRYQIYSDPIQLSGQINYVWYRSCGDNAFNDSELYMFKAEYIQLPIAPKPVLSFDDLSNTITLSHVNDKFNGIIEYVITESDIYPGDEISLITYTEAIVLVKDINYIWGRCTGDVNFRDSELTLLGITKRRVLKNAPEVIINFDNLNNMLTLSVDDNNFKGFVRYIISGSDQQPDKGTEFNTYSEPIQLYDDINYVWFFTSGDSEYKDSELTMVKTLKRKLDTAPIPILKFNPIENSFTLSISGSDFNGYIEYWISSSSNEPGIDQKYERYNGPVTLSDNINYIWARCAGDPDFKDSSITFLMMTEAFARLDAPEVITSFDNRLNVINFSINNQEFKGRIEYFISETEQTPDETTNFLVYSSPIQLTQQTNFIWYRTRGDSDYNDSELKSINTIALPLAPTPVLTYEDLNN
ncbi:MAG: hypothetical protein K2G40_05295, partial [Muribaculaceae bacterium]|nr:hypothetical protein [Muribaculaceae bacterium]